MCCGLLTLRLWVFLCFVGFSCYKIACQHTYTHSHTYTYLVTIQHTEKQQQ